MNAKTFGRFTAKFTVGDDCWLWTGARSSAGYGQFWIDSRLEYAHRVAYELMVELIPEGLVIDHLCRVRNCINPKHLEPVTQGENLRRADIYDIGGYHSAKTHCPQGHSYSGNNLYVRPQNGKRECRACMRSSNRRAKAKARR